jgi:hypothetical protein
VAAAPGADFSDRWIVHEGVQISDPFPLGRRVHGFNCREEAAESIDMTLPTVVVKGLKAFCLNVVVVQLKQEEVVQVLVGLCYGVEILLVEKARDTPNNGTQ